jgi:hypothetical protein
MGVDEPKRKSSDAVNPKDTPSVKSPLAAGRPTIGPHIPQAPGNSPQPPAAPQDSTPPWKKKIDTVAACVAVGLLVANIFQLGITQNAVSVARAAVTEASKQNGLSKTALVFAQRAYLAVAGIDDMDPVLKVHIENFGHAPATLTGGTFEYTRSVGLLIVDKRAMPIELPKNAPVNPEKASAYVLMLTVPQFESRNGNDIRFVNGSITYNTGFDTFDTLWVRMNYDTKKRKWIQTNEGVGVEFDKSKNAANQTQK